jgi:hypothetical protein
MKKQIITIVLGLTVLGGTVLAHQPVRELEKNLNTKNTTLNLELATEIKDPTVQSLAVYGRLETPDEVDLYKFKVSKTVEIPVEVLVPVRVSNQDFKPSYAFIQEGDSEIIVKNPLFTIPTGYFAEFIDVKKERDIFFEPFSVEKLNHGNEKKFVVEAGKTYFIAVYDPIGYMGDYSLGVGTVENFSDVSFLNIIKEVFLIKLALVGGIDAPWLDIIGLFLFMAGFIVGLGAVTVIDIHGFLARKSKYWTKATIQTHKVTKPLIWAGIILATVGGSIYYRLSGLSSTATFHLLLLIILILNGIFLSFKISPYLLKQEKSEKPDKLLPKKMQIKITISFIISFLGWWSSLFLLVWHVLVAR